MSIKIQKSEGPSFILYSLIAVVVLVVGSILIPKACDSAKPEYMYSTDLAVGKKAYADIVSLAPEFTISKYKTSPATSLVCRCQTTDGITVWIYMDTYQYDKFEGSNSHFSIYSNEQLFDDIRFRTPVRVHGKISNEDKLKVIGLSQRTNSKTVLRLDSIDSQ
jgi:hypothetical protein